VCFVSTRHDTLLLVIMSDQQQQQQDPLPVYTAIVSGATGAVGRLLVGELLTSNWTVITVGRRALTAIPAPFEDLDLKQLQEDKRLLQHTVESSPDIADLSNIDSLGKAWVAAADAKTGIDAAFCCLGTTSGDRSEDAFRMVDEVFVDNFARAASLGKTKYFGLVSSTGANAKSMFLYMRVKGQAENKVSSYGMPCTSLFRPGMLGRGDLTRTKEKVLGVFAKALPSIYVAQAMRSDAEKFLSSYSPSSSAANAAPTRQILTNTEIKVLAKVPKKASTCTIM
jgi:oxidoreductase